MVWYWKNMKGAGLKDFDFLGGWVSVGEGATPNPKIYNTEKYDNSLYKGTSNYLMSHL